MGWKYPEKDGLPTPVASNRVFENDCPYVFEYGAKNGPVFRSFGWRINSTDEVNDLEDSFCIRLIGPNTGAINEEAVFRWFDIRDIT